ncbi:Increased rDNA silencing protein [Bachmanniomyces sp. S44760]|nr:Increased rDNA silencing protein [Bachmanniomyces sp. S44760]
MTTPNLATRFAASTGASLAFHIPPQTQEVNLNTHSSNDGARVAAAFAGLGRQITPSKADAELMTKSGSRSGASRRPPLNPDSSSASKPVATTGRNEFLNVPTKGQLVIQQRQSPSHVAATLAAAAAAAASRSSQRPSQLNKSTSEHTSRPQSVIKRGRIDSTLSNNTGSLVKLFESKKEPEESFNEQQHCQMKGHSRPHSPMPIRPIPVQKFTSSDHARDFVLGSNESVTKRESHMFQPKLPRAHHPTKALDAESIHSTGTRETRSIRYSPLRLTPQLTADSLANAIVASSLASSRAPSPSKQMPSLPIRPPSKSVSPFWPNHSYQTHIAESRTPSPQKTIRKTLRSKEHEEEYKDASHQAHHYRFRPGHGNSMPVRSKSSKHYRGSRKKWNDSISDAERKRYEGVWAANKGLFLPIHSQDHVLNLVVKELWSRSKLGTETLSDVWNLVDQSGEGALGRDEFVSGMWLVDQCLKGRKLPAKLSEAVLFSVRRLSGVKVANNWH